MRVKHQSKAKPGTKFQQSTIMIHVLPKAQCYHSNSQIEKLVLILAKSRFQLFFSLSDIHVDFTAFVKIPLVMGIGLRYNRRKKTY